MNELRRMAYLDAMGVDSYISRGQLPGAAATRRLAIVRPAMPPVSSPATPASVPQQQAPGSREAVSMPRIDVTARTAPVQAPPQEQRQQNRQSAAQVPRFSLAAIVSGGWLWLEELGGMPLSSDQVWLVQSMARALDVQVGPCTQEPKGARPDVAQFDWPIHTNAQLELGEEAARAGVEGFVGRKLERHRCRGVILMGPACEKWVNTSQLPVPGVSIASTADVLSDSSLKRVVWRSLQALVEQQ